MGKKKTGIRYVEPAEYFPKDIRKKFGLGEFAKDDEPEEKPAKKPAKKK